MYHNSRNIYLTTACPQARSEHRLAKLSAELCAHLWHVGACNVKSNSFRVNWSLTTCLDVLFNASGGSGSRRMDTELQADRPKNNNNKKKQNTKKKQSLHVLQRRIELKYTDKNNNYVFSFSVVRHYATDWNLETIQRAGPWLQAEAAVQKKRKERIKDGVDPCRVALKFCWTDPVTAHA